MTCDVVPAGEWRHGRRHGYGEVVFADGVRFRGRWQDDCWVQVSGRRRSEEEEEQGPGGL